jgi:hypothetical protein
MLIPNQVFSIFKIVGLFYAFISERVTVYIRDLLLAATYSSPVFISPVYVQIKSDVL